MDRTQAIEQTANLVVQLAKQEKKQVKVDLDSPDFTVVIQVYKAIAGLSVVNQITDLCDFNLRKAIK